MEARWQGEPLGVGWVLPGRAAHLGGEGRRPVGLASTPWFGPSVAFDLAGQPRLLLSASTAEGLELKADRVGVGAPELRASGRLRAAPDGREQLVLRPGEQVVLRDGAWSLRCALAPLPARFARGGWLDRRALRYQLFSAAFAVLGLALLASVPPSAAGLALGAGQAPLPERSRFEYAEQRVVSVEPPGQPAEGAAGASGRAERGAEGRSGRPEAPHRPARVAVRGRGEGRSLGRERAPSVSDAATAGVVGVLAARPLVAAPSSVYGAEQALGGDPMDALGGLLGDPGERFGFGGLGMRGVGRHGGGGAIGTIGRGPLGRFGCGGRCSASRGSGRTFWAAGFLGPRRSRGPASHVPRIRCGGSGCRAQVRGALAREVIRRIVRRHHGEIRHCYAQGLQRNPALEGRLVVRFLVRPDGSVGFAGIEESAVGDPAVEACVTRAVRRWVFPPSPGMVSVVYPFHLRSAG